MPCPRTYSSYHTYLYIHYLQAYHEPTKRLAGLIAKLIEHCSGSAELRVSGVSLGPFSRLHNCSIIYTQTHCVTRNSPENRRLFFHHLQIEWTAYDVHLHGNRNRFKTFNLRQNSQRCLNFEWASRQIMTNQIGPDDQPQRFSLAPNQVSCTGIAVIFI